MLNQHELEDLIACQMSHPVLSVYLDIDPQAAAADEFKIHLKHLLKPFERDAPDDIETITRYVEHEFDRQARSLIVFSCLAEDFFRTYPIGVPLRSRARRMDCPYVKPLAALLDTYGHYGVTLVDRQGARLFHFHLGELREQEGTMGESIRSTKTGGGSQEATRRGGGAGHTHHTRAAADRNIREAAEFAINFFRHKQVRRILIGGTDSNVARFMAELPKQWQSLVIGTFPIDMGAGHAQVLARAMDVAQQAERQRQASLVEALTTAAAKGHDAVAGLDETLPAVHAGRVLTLVLSDGYRAPGFRCSSCNYLSASRHDRCPFCGGQILRMPDAVEVAVRQVMSQEGEVEFIHNNHELERLGNIGGLLRY
jgi:peptide chain release factor subunit 1